MFGAEYDLSPGGDLALVAGLLCLGTFVVLLLGGIYLVIRDTIRQRGRWGVCLGRPSCRQCATPAPLVRIMPDNWQQILWGGWTCKECGIELDKYGWPIQTQKNLAKWAVLRNVDSPPEQRSGQKPHDERIRATNDQTTPEVPS